MLRQTLQFPIQATECLMLPVLDTIFGEGSISDSSREWLQINLSASVVLIYVSFVCRVFLKMKGELPKQRVPGSFGCGTTSIISILNDKT